MKMRLEKDSLGQHEVPFHAYYGIQTQRAVENYRISGYRAHPQLISAMGMIKKAAARANRELKLIDEKRARAIERAAEEVIEGKWNGEFVVDVYQAGAGVSFHMNANEVIANRAIEFLGGKRGDYALCHPNDHVNCSQSTNDVFPTAMRLASVFLFDDVLRAVAELAKSFSRKARDFDRILKSGRTHLMDAVPIRLGQEFAAYATSMRRCEGVLEYALGLLKEVGLGRIRGRDGREYASEIPEACGETIEQDFGTGASTHRRSSLCDAVEPGNECGVFRASQSGAGTDPNQQ